MNQETGLSPLGRRFAQFMERLNKGPDPALYAASALLCQCGVEGHVCLDLGSIAPATCEAAGLSAPPPGSWAESLKKCRVVGGPGDYKPLILDHAGRLYLERLYSCEKGLARAILERSRVETWGLDLNGLRTSLDRLFPGDPGQTDWQKLAAATAVLRRFSVISGGPGTGKTRTAARIIALILELFGEKAGPVILCAPTGKAAQRLQSSVAAAKDELSSVLPERVRKAFPENASTIHRLLGAIPGKAGFAHGPGNPLVAGTIVADEASMIDLLLMSRLFSALSPDTRVILLGDSNQLASVDPGSVLGDLCAGPASGPSVEFASVLKAATGCDLAADPSATGLSDGVAHLKRNYRFGSGSETAVLARLIIEGDETGAAEFLRERANGEGSVNFVEYDDPASISEILEKRMLEGYGAFLKAATVSEALSALDRFRVLAAHREGPGSAAHANAVLERALVKRGLIPSISPAYQRRGVIITRNDGSLRLFNGDCGVMFDGRAWFSGPENAPLSFSPLVLPAHETVFAMTVHKSQGAEFEEVLILLPPRPSQVLTRELFYTAVTRARGRITVVSPLAVAAHAVKAKISRRSGLSDMLREK
ncbi:MAG: exodeoxyribonuclease V subunit alpha [Deltaproteobacteria bacterium]|nr:exodeoxyribonuclease V subunit alpha [Deltaproteobacteria bacterium]